MNDGPNPSVSMPTPPHAALTRLPVLPDEGLRRLILAVCQQALVDAARSSAQDGVRAEARTWLLSEDALAWFDAAGLGLVETEDLLVWINKNCPGHRRLIHFRENQLKDHEEQKR